MATPTEVRFRVTFFGADGDTPIWGTASDYVVSEASFGTGGWSHPRPYMLVPENILQTETDFLRGSSKIGGMTVKILDKRVTSSDQTTGIVTEYVDELVGSEVIVERYFGSVPEWRTIFRGRCESYAVSTSDVVVYEFELSDPRGYENDDVLFTVNNTFAILPESGPLANYGALPGGGYLLPAVTDYLRGTVDVRGPIGGIYYLAIGLDEDDAVLLRPHAQADRSTGTYPGLSLRWRTSSPEGSWNLITNCPVVPQIGSQLVRGNDPLVASAWETNAGIYAAWKCVFSATSTAGLPTDGTVIDVQIVAGRTTEETPFFWDAGTLGDLLEDILNGDFTEAAPREKYDSTALAAFKANSPAARFIERSPQNRRKWVERNIYQASRHAPALTQSYEIAPTQWVTPSPTDNVPYVTRDSIRPPGDWTHEVPQVVNTVSGSYIEESIASQEFITKTRTKRFLGFPVGTEEFRVEADLSRWERFIETEIKFRVQDDDSVTKLGTRAVNYGPITVRTIGLVEGRVEGGDTQDPLAVKLAEEYIESAKKRYLPRGAPRFRADFKMSDTIIRDVVAGDWLILDVPWLPEYATGRREARRYMQVYGIADRSPEWRTLYLEDGGAIDGGSRDRDNPATDCLGAGSGGTNVGPSPAGKALRKFTSDANIVNNCGEPVTIRALLIGGGGGGGTAPDIGDASAGGGGGAGGVLGAGTSANGFVEITIPDGVTIPVTIGAGGGAGAAGEQTVIWADANGNALDPMVDTPVYAAAGGGQGGTGATGGTTGSDGGSGGGAGAATGTGATAGGNAVPSTQGSEGGNGFANLGLTDCTDAGGGGGGSFAGAGAVGNNQAGGAGGAGSTLSYWGVPLGGGGSGGLQRRDNGGGGCAGVGSSQVSQPGTAGSGYGAGGGGAAGGVGASNGSDGAVFIEYVGARQELTPPPSTETVDSNDDQVVCVTIDSADWPEIELPGYRVRVDYAVSTLEPAEGSGDWILMGYLEAPGTVCSPPLPTGVTVWTRKIAEANNLPPSPPDTATDTDTTCTAGLLAFALTEVDGTVTATWEKNACVAGIRFSAAATTAASNADVTLTQLDDVDADDGSYVLSPTIAKGQELRATAQCWDGYTTVTGNAELEDDEFTRSDSATVGGNWTEIEGGAGSAAKIVSNNLVLDSNDGAANTGVYLASISRGEVFAQWGAVLVGSGSTGFVARWANQTTTSDDGYVFRPAGIARLQSAGLTTLNNFASAIPEAVDVTFQAYLADGVQEFSGTEDGVGSFPNETASSADTTFNGVSGTVGFRARGSTDVTIRYARIYSTKYVTVAGLSTGWSIEVENGGGSVVASATESSGTARVDLSAFGGCTEEVPAAGFAAVVVKNGGGVEQYRLTTAIYPGFTATWNTSSTSFEGITGNEGRTYALTIERVAPTIASQDDIDNALGGLVLDNDLNIVWDQNLDPVKDGA